MIYRLTKNIYKGFARRIRYLSDSFISLLSEVLILNCFYIEGKTTPIYTILKLHLTTLPIGPSLGRRSAIGYRLSAIPLGRHHLLVSSVTYLPVLPAAEGRRKQSLTNFPLIKGPAKVLYSRLFQCIAVQISFYSSCRKL